MRIAFALPVVAALGLAACDQISVPGSKTTPIPGNYMVTRVNGDPVPAPGITLTLQPNGSFSGRSLCNTYQGRNANSYPGFRVGAFSNTKKACNPNLQRVEVDYFTVLTKVNSLTQGAGGISLGGVDDSNNRLTIDATRR